MVSQLNVHAAQSEMDFDELKAWLCAPLSPEPQRSQEEQVKYEKEVEEIKHYLQYGPTPTFADPDFLPLELPRFSQDTRTEAMILDSPESISACSAVTLKNLHSPSFKPWLEKKSEIDELPIEMIPVNTKFAIEGKTAVAIKNRCTNFTEFKNLFGKFSEKPSLEQMRFEIALHMLTVSSLRGLGIYQLPHYGHGACSVQLADGSIRLLSKTIESFIDYFINRSSSLETENDLSIIDLHARVKKKMLGAKIIFSSIY
jgi:hypothetical protein